MKVLILENIRSAHNVGSIFRTADGAGVNKIYLVGYTPKPVDRFGRQQPEISKTSLGASDVIEWEVVDNCEILINQLKKEKIEVVAVEQSPDSTLLVNYTVPPKVAYILGNEITGVDEKTLEKADKIIEIPMLGSKESLNVSVSAGIVLYYGLKGT